MLDSWEGQTYTILFTHFFYFFLYFLKDLNSIWFQNYVSFTWLFLYQGGWRVNKDENVHRYAVRAVKRERGEERETGYYRFLWKNNQSSIKQKGDTKRRHKKVT